MNLSFGAVWFSAIAAIYLAMAHSKHRAMALSDHGGYERNRVKFGRNLDLATGLFFFIIALFN